MVGWDKLTIAILFTRLLARAAAENATLVKAFAWRCPHKLDVVVAPKWKKVIVFYNCYFLSS
jgi:hypothetical protein